MTGHARMLTAAACVGLIAAIAAAVLLTRRSNEPPAGVPVQMSVDDLRETASKARQPLYWAGTRPGTRFELTRTRGGKSFVRYIPDGVEAGDKRPAFLTVATYPQPDAYSVAYKSSRGAAMLREPTPSGGLATWSRKRRSSVYVAYPGTDQLIEVFSPRAGDAQRLVLAGDVGPVGEVAAAEPAPRSLKAPGDLSR